MAKMTFSETDNQKEIYNVAKLLMDIVPITSNERIPVFCSHPFTDFIYTPQKYSLQGTTQGRYLTGGVPPVRFSM